MKPSKKKLGQSLDNSYWKLMTRIAYNLKRIRTQKALTQEDMSNLGFERRWYQRLESGKYSVSLPTLDKLARTHKVDISELFRSEKN